jgi:hypothetical protein
VPVCQVLNAIPDLDLGQLLGGLGDGPNGLTDGLDGLTEGLTGDPTSSPPPEGLYGGGLT